MNEEYKKPEFIYVDDDASEDVSSSYEEQRLFTALNQLNKTSYPFSFRILALFLSLLCGILAVVAAFGTFFWLIWAILSFFKAPHAVQQLQKGIRMMKKMFVLFFGGLLAVFSPPMGFGFVIMYFLLSGEELNDAILKKMMGSHHPQN